MPKPKQTIVRNGKRYSLVQPTANKTTATNLAKRFRSHAKLVRVVKVKPFKIPGQPKPMRYLVYTRNK